MTPTVFQSLDLSAKEQLLDVAANQQFRILIGLQIKEKKEAQSSLPESLEADKFRFKYYQLQREILNYEDLLLFLDCIREEFIEEH